LDIEPNFITRRNDRHWHAYWVANNLTKDTFQNTQRRLIKRYGSDPQVVDLPHTLRLAGTLHQKNPAEPVLITGEILHENARDASTMLMSLPELTEDDPDDRSYCPVCLWSHQHLRAETFGKGRSRGVPRIPG
jgi:hypothetical protein